MKRKLAVQGNSVLAAHLLCARHWLKRFRQVTSFDLTVSLSIGYPYSHPCVLIPILLMRKLKLREVKTLSSGDRI